MPAVAVLAALAAGCSDPGDIGKTVEVKGKVTLGGNPLPGGMVQFHPAEGSATKLVPFGPIDASGNYSLSTGSSTKTVKGAPLGKYKVTINTTAPPPATASPVGTTPTGTPPPASALPQIDAVYTDPVRTPLEITVVESGGQYDLPLK